MLTDNRKNQILEMLNKNGSVRVSELSRLFNVSEVTVRNYLMDMENNGLLSRIHGGAIVSYKPYFGMNFRERIKINNAEKSSIAQKTADLVKPNDTVMMNSGTTTYLVFRNLPTDYPLNIITNSIAIALEASDNSNFRVVLLGGSVNTKYQFTYGNEALEQLKNYHVNKLILSVDGIDTQNGFSSYYSEEAYIDRAMLKCADTCIVIADHTKLKRNALVKITDISGADHIVTNGEFEKDEIAQLQNNGINIIKAE